VLTGETGAGKSIIVDALALVLGDKADTSMIRTGHDFTRVEASFDVQGLPADEGSDISGEVIVSREVKREGKGRATINGSMAPIARLKSLGEGLVDLHGQHEHQSLLKVSTHLDTLDAYAGLLGLRNDHETLFSELSRVKDQIRRIQDGTRERAARRDYLQFVVRELEEASLSNGEEQQLLEEERVLASAEKLIETASSVLDAVYQSENSLADGVGRAASTLGSMVEIDGRLSDVVDLLGSSHAQLEEAAHQLRDYSGTVSSDPARLEQVNERLVLIADLKKKYGPMLQDVLSYLESARSELSEIDADDTDLGELVAREDAIRSELEELAERLRKGRKDAAGGLEKKVTSELVELAMEKVKFGVDFEETEHLETGIDLVEYLISPNPGEPLLPLRKIASGGELSRIMLALKRILAGSDKVSTLIFDEVDTGIGGRIAAILGIKLKEMAATHQVLCITHLAAVAACADQHILVEKTADTKRTIIMARYLSDDERVQELARMMGGLEVTDGIVDSARELLEEARG